MEIIEIIIKNEDQVPEESKEVINQVIDDVSKNIEKINGEVQTTENQVVEEHVEKNDDEVVPSTTPKPIEEQENAIDTNPIAAPVSVSPSRLNVPFKEVNENEKEACTTIVNGIENINHKKREFDNEDEQVQEKILDHNERIGDQTKKVKITESTNAPSMEIKETENNVTANGITTVEV